MQIAALLGPKTEADLVKPDKKKKVSCTISFRLCLLQTDYCSAAHCLAEVAKKNIIIIFCSTATSADMSHADPACERTATSQLSLCMHG